MKRQNKHQNQTWQGFEETEQASEQDMEGVLELSDWGCKTTVINMLRALMDKVDSLQKQMDSVSREIEIPRCNFKKRDRDKKYCNRIEESF